MTSEEGEGEGEWARGAWVGVRVLIVGVEMVQIWEGRGGKEEEVEEFEDQGFREMGGLQYCNAKDQPRTTRTRPLSGPHGPARELRGACEVICVVLVSFHTMGKDFV